MHFGIQQGAFAFPRGFRTGHFTRDSSAYIWVFNVFDQFASKGERRIGKAYTLPMYGDAGLIWRYSIGTPLRSVFGQAIEDWLLEVTR